MYHQTGDIVKYLRIVGTVIAVNKYDFMFDPYNHTVLILIPSGESNVDVLTADSKNVEFICKGNNISESLYLSSSVLSVLTQIRLQK